MPGLTAGVSARSGAACFGSGFVTPSVLVASGLALDTAIGDVAPPAAGLLRVDFVGSALLEHPVPATPSSTAATAKCLSITVRLIV